MGTETKPEVVDFLKACEKDPALQVKLQKASADDISQAARDLGYSVNVRDLIAMIDEEAKEEELSDTELEAVAGGASSWLIGSCSGCSSGASCGLICRTIAGQKKARYRAIDK